MLTGIIAGFCAFAATAGAADDDPVTVTDILDKAGCPLTADQKKSIEDIDESEGFMAMMSVNQMFTDEQTDALIEVLGEMSFGGMGGGGMGGGMDMPRMVNNLFQVIIFEKEGVPMTKKQVEELKGLEMGPDAFQQMNEIFTDAQSEIMQKYMGGMGGGMGGGPGGGF